MQNEQEYAVDEKKYIVVKHMDDNGINVVFSDDLTFGEQRLHIFESDDEIFDGLEMDKVYMYAEGKVWNIDDSELHNLMQEIEWKPIEERKDLTIIDDYSKCMDCKRHIYIVKNDLGKTYRYGCPCDFACNFGFSETEKNIHGSWVRKKEE